MKYVLKIKSALISKFVNKEDKKEHANTDFNFPNEVSQIVKEVMGNLFSHY